LGSRKKVIVGLSGGVDSSVAAYLLKQQGFEVTGVSMSIWGGGLNAVPSGRHSCYGPDELEEIREAREVAQSLEIPFHVFDCSRRYKELVLDYFRNEYLSGRTPNPCVRCNQLIKFGMLPEIARAEGLVFDYFATGHYARVGRDEKTGRYLLYKGTDSKKDQTYFIYRLSQEQLSKVLFPLGELTKKEVRGIAANIHVELSDKEESQDFYSGDYKELINAPESEGEIITRQDRVLGIHKGIWNYTIGQRKGLGIAFPEPLYVTGLDTKQNQVIVGTREEIMSSAFIVSDPNWIAIANLDHPMSVNVKIRSASKEAEATIEPAPNGQVKVTFRRPNDSITPGQSAVFYREDTVIGGGIIESIIKS
jgi:tRNA-specific 2-thiouridylase